MMARTVLAAVWLIGLALSGPPAGVAASVPDSGRNLLVSAVVRGEGVLGDVGVLGSPVAIPEGTQVLPGETVLLLDANASVTVDLGGVVPVACLLAQGHHRASFLVEGSPDGASWTALWTVPPIYAGEGYPPMGLRTRTVCLPLPVPARFLRIRGIASGGAQAPPMALARIGVFSSVPPGWPPEPVFVGPNAAPPPFPSVDAAVDRRLKLGLSAVAAVLLLWCAIARRRGESPRARRIRRASLLALLAIACVAWPHFLNFHFTAPYHMHEQIHHYLGGKYFRELGYDGLYDAVSAADASDGLADRVAGRQVRDLAGKGLVPGAVSLARSPAVTARFTPRRWEEFRTDVRWFRGNVLSPAAWDNVWLDHGFNATPAWVVAGSAIAGIAPPSHRWLSLLSSIDLVLIAASFGLLLSGFGLEAAFGAIAFFCLNGIAPFGFTGGSLLRYDWWFCLALGLWALSRRRDALAGAALAMASLLRVFPASALAGALLPSAAACASARSLAPLRGLRRLLVGAGGAAAVLVPLSILVAGRPAAWAEFAANSRAHMAQEGVANFMGLSSIPWIGPWRVPIALAAVALAAWGARRLRPAEAAAAALLLLPFLAVLSNYYYVALALTGILWPVAPACSVLLVAAGCLAWIPSLVSGDLFFRYDVQTLLAAGCALAMLSLLARAPARRAEVDTPAPSRSLRSMGKTGS